MLAHMVIHVTLPAGFSCPGKKRAPTLSAPAFDSAYAFGLKRSRRLALLTTVIDDSAIAAPATTGLSNVPVSGQRIPAAIGMPSEL